MKRIGLTQRVDVVSRHAERRDALDQRWARLLVLLGFWPVPLANAVEEVGSYVDALLLDGVILTGGNDIVGTKGGSEFAPERDLFERRLLDVCGVVGLPLLGVCRGMQLMNIHYGGMLERLGQHAGGRHSVTTAAPGLTDWPERLTVNSFHNFGVLESGRSGSLTPIAWAEDATIEAVEHKTLRQVAIMWHPEREPILAPHDAAVFRAMFGQGQA